MTCFLSWNLAIKIDGWRVAVHHGEKSFHLLHRVDVSDQAGRLVSRRYHNNVFIYQELHAGHKPVRQEIDV